MNLRRWWRERRRIRHVARGGTIETREAERRFKSEADAQATLRRLMRSVDIETYSVFWHDDMNGNDPAWLLRYTYIP